VSRAAALLLAAALAGAGCTTSSAWGSDRLLDLTDVVDVRYGTGVGLGVQLDATMIFGTGLGYSTVDRTRAWFGRHSVETLNTAFFGMVLGSTLGWRHTPPDPAHGWFDVLFVNVSVILGHPMEASGDESWFAYDDGPPLIDRFRFGTTLFLPGVHGGLYLNVGEVFDFVLGIFFLDPSGDDGVPKLPETAEQATAPQGSG